MNKTCFYVFFVKLFGNISFDNLISEGDVYLQSFSMLQWQSLVLLYSVKVNLSVWFRLSVVSKIKSFPPWIIFNLTIWTGRHRTSNERFASIIWNCMSLDSGRIRIWNDRINSKKSKSVTVSFFQFNVQR